MDEFKQIFQALTDHKPLYWQSRLHALFMAGTHHIPPALDLPTGLGKTSVMAVWLAAKIIGATLPNRLVYVVDRRTVVDQATGEAEKLKARAEAADLLPDLAISTLRGQHLDNRRWMEDPAAPAIIIGTVDMIGSRLLFQGYGVSTGMRPFQAGLIGADTLLVLDEAHLCPPFQALLESVETVRGLQPGVEPVPPFRLLSLSATGKLADNAFALTDDDRNDPFVQQRLDAAKRLTVLDADASSKLEGQLADAAPALATKHGGRIAVFCTSRDVAQKVVALLNDKKAKRPEGAVVLLAGARRVKEREDARRELVVAGFLPPTDEEKKSLTILSGPTFLVATAAGEVGIDLDADHAVMDLVAAERMIQRLGRVNRKGGDGRTAQVRVINLAGKGETDEETTRRDACRRLLESLTPLADGSVDASPGALRILRDHPLLAAASTPAPLYPALDRPTLDAWAMTSLKTHPGRPDIAPWLRGWVEDEEPEVTLVWRRWPWDGEFRLPDARSLADFFERAPPRMAERLQVPRSMAMNILADRAKAKTGLKDETEVLIAVGDKIQTLTLGKLKEKRDREGFFQRSGSGTTIIVCRALGGLDGRGLMSTDAGPPSCLDEGWDEDDLRRVGTRHRKAAVTRLSGGGNKPWWHIWTRRRRRRRPPS